MAKIDPRWSLDALLRDYRPRSGWRDWFSEAYIKAMESAQAEEQLAGWKAAATIFGDMHALVLCLFVSHHGRTLVGPDSQEFLHNIDLCLWDMGLARPARSDQRGVPAGDLGKSDTFQRDREAARDWLAEQLQPFHGNVKRAAEFAMRLTAARFGLLRGPANPSMAELLDESLWQRTTD